MSRPETDHAWEALQGPVAQVLQETDAAAVASTLLRFAAHLHFLATGLHKSGSAEEIRQRRLFMNLVESCYHAQLQDVRASEMAFEAERKKYNDRPSYVKCYQTIGNTWRNALMSWDVRDGCYKAVNCINPYGSPYEDRELAFDAGRRWAEALGVEFRHE